MTGLRAAWLCALLLCLQPLGWLWPCVFGERRFVPYDLAEYPPVALQLDEAQHRAVRSGKNHDATEVPVWLLPEIAMAGRELRAGRPATWNPHARGGAVMFANGALGLAYPPTWLLLASSDPERWLGTLAWLQLAIAGLLTAGLLRHVGLSWPAVWLGATLFQLSAPLAVNAYWWMRLGSLIWLPGLLWALLCFAAGERNRRGPLAAVAVTFALPWLAGFPPYATVHALLGGLLALRLLAERLGTDGSAAARRLTLRLATAFGLGICLAAPQVLPALAFFPASARTPDPDLARIASTAYETYGLLGYLLPDALGHPSQAELLPYGLQPLAYLWSELFAGDGRRLQPNYNYTEYTVYFGSLGLLLATYGAVRGRGHLRWWLLLTLALLLALALFLPGVRWLYLLPGIKNVFPMRWLVPATLLWAWLAAIGFDRLALVERRSLRRLGYVALAAAALVAYGATRPAAQHAADPGWPATAIAARYTNPAIGIDITPAAAVAHLQAGAPAGTDRIATAIERLAEHGWQAAGWLVVFGVLLLAFAILKDGARRWALWSTLPLALLQLWLHGAPLLRGCERAHPWHTAVHGFLADSAATSAATGGFALARGSRGEALPSQLPPGQLLVPGVRDLQFLTFFDAHSLQPLARLLARYFGDELATRHTAKGFLTTALPDHPGLLAHPLLDLLGLRYVLATEPMQHAGVRVGPDFQGPRGTFYIYERSRAAPRAFAVPELVLLPDHDAVLNALLADDLAPRERAFAVASELPANPAPRAGSAGERSLRFVRDEATRIELEVDAGAAPWLLLTDTWLPGWSASIDGQPVPLHRANHHMRLVALPERRCRVAFHYSVPGLLAGLLLAGAAGSLLVVLGLLRMPRSR
jgi:hypothetical protein